MDVIRATDAALDDKTKPLCNLLREIGAILEDRPVDDAAVLGAAEAKKVNAELKAIAVDVKKTMQTGFREVNNNIAAVGEKVDAVAAKVTRGKRRCKYDDETVAFCVGVMAAAEGNTTIKNSLNTRVTYSAVFDYNRSELEKRGILDVAEFTRIIRAHQAREQRARQKSAAKHNTKRGENGIMSSMIHAHHPCASGAGATGAAEIRRETQHETRRKWYNVKHEEPRKFNPRTDARHCGRSGLALAFWRVHDIFPAAADHMLGDAHLKLRASRNVHEREPDCGLSAERDRSAGRAS